jgi:hypothetical protein
LSRAEIELLGFGGKGETSVMVLLEDDLLGAFEEVELGLNDRIVRTWEQSFALNKGRALLVQTTKHEVNRSAPDRCYWARDS